MFCCWSTWYASWTNPKIRSGAFDSPLVELMLFFLMIERAMENGNIIFPFVHFLKKFPPHEMTEADWKSITDVGLETVNWSSKSWNSITCSFKGYWFYYYFIFLIQTILKSNQINSGERVRRLWLNENELTNIPESVCGERYIIFFFIFIIFFLFHNLFQTCVC